MAEVPSAQLLTGRFVDLHEIATNDDLDAALRIVNAGANPLRWRTGRYYTRKELGIELNHCYAKFAIAKKDGTIVGIIEVLGVNHGEHIAHVGVILDPSVQRKMWPWEGMAIFLDWVFGYTPLSPPNRFNTVQFETSGLNVAQFAKRDHGLFTKIGFDEREDVHEYAITRAAWVDSTLRAQWCRRNARRQNEGATA
jgi:RimJ/RimL family protein N-acetyltransferase